MKLRTHYVLLALFALLVLCIWMTPALLAGYPYWVSLVLGRAQDLAKAGILTDGRMRLVAHVIAIIHPWISWENVLGWSAVSAAAFALALIPWWWSVQKLFDRTVAWLSTIVMSFLPMYWAEVLRLEGYTFAFFFLFLGFALFFKFQEQRRGVAVVLAGVCFGFALASRSTFITFLPWMVLVYLYLQRRHWQRSVIEVCVYCAVAYGAFVLPLYPNAMQPNMSMVERIQVFLPSLEEKTPGEGHLYPDQYIFDHYKDEFDAYTQQRIQDEESFLVRQQDQNYRMLFGVTDTNIFIWFLNGVWLFVNILPPLILMETVGGVFLWIFILPGIYVCYRQRKQLLWMMLGLWLSMEFIIRFILHFGRDHLIDVGWMLALFAALGISAASGSVAESSKKLSAKLIAGILVLIVSLQLVQANRKLFTRLYERSTAPEIFAATEALQEVPDDAVVAHPRRADYFIFADQTPITMHIPTIDFLLERNALAQAFKENNITHIIGYDAEHTALIEQVLKDIKTIDMPESHGVEMTPFVRLLLHVVR